LATAPTGKTLSSSGHMLLAALLLILLFGLAAGTALSKSLTFDEGFYIVRGWAFFRTGELLPLGHPPLTNEISGLGVLLEPGLPDPRTLDGWDEANPEKVSEDLLWARGLDFGRVTFLARLPVVLLGLLLGAVVYRWACELYGPWSGVLALALAAFSPNMLAHTSLATTDLGVTAFYATALYAWWRFLERRTARWLVLTGLVVGLAQASKFSAALLVPTLIVLAAWAAMRRGPLVVHGKGRIGATLARLTVRLSRWPLGRLWTVLAVLALIGVIGLFVLWATHLFQMRPYPLSAYVAELKHFLWLAGKGHRAYFHGRFSLDGFWYYHPMALLLKTPLPTLLLLVVAMLTALVRRPGRAEGAVIFPLLVYLGASMLGSLNVGVRYLLPILPLMFVFSARLLQQGMPLMVLRAGYSAITVLALAGVSLWYFPDYLAYFNMTVGGPANGLKWLADSNLDWGQDLPALAEYVRDRGLSKIYLSYFGQADPAAYGIDAIRLPGWPPPEPESGRPAYHPMNPQPGVYAVSASNLVGLQLYGEDAMGYFLEREPLARLGYSIYIYEVPSAGRPRTDDSAWLAQCAVPQAAETEERLRRLTGVDDLPVIYFDCQQSLFFYDTPGWIVLPAGSEPVISLPQADYVGRAEDGTLRYSAWIVNGAPAPPAARVEFPPLNLPLPIAGYVELLGYQVNRAQALPGEELLLTAWWRVRQPPPPPVSIFAHMLAPDSSTVTAADGLGVPAELWRPGMVLIQQHRFTIPPGTPPGDYTLSVGLYSLSDQSRFPVYKSGSRVIDQIVLRTVQVAAPPE